MPEKVRLDVLLTELGLAQSRAQAQRLVMAGQVRVDGQPELTPARRVNRLAAVELESRPRFVSRGGEKLEAALNQFHCVVEGRTCADVGASTGGFTDCLLQAGARRVYAIDVGYGVLDWKLRNDPRVVCMERTNARHLHGIPEPVSFITIDASFISLKLLLPVVQGWLDPAGGEAVVLIKPQFEAGREEVNHGEGVIRNPEVHRRVVTEITEYARQTGWGVLGIMRSPLRGPKGNIEFLAHLAYPGLTDPRLAERIEVLFAAGDKMDTVG
ncbi:MAG: TlyA family RNA methyltransferase [Chloroflexi bacterium]|nr:TlyA family RNA methyltransferase [Chloroflexota bacterium]